MGDKGSPSRFSALILQGIVSSLQLARFLSVDCRPTIVRAVSRHMPLSQSRAFVGRLMADPSFLYKLALEQVRQSVGAARWLPRWGESHPVSICVRVTCWAASASGDLWRMVWRPPNCRRKTSDS